MANTLGVRGIPRQLLHAMRVEAACQGLSMAEYVRQALTNMVKVDKAKREATNSEAIYNFEG